MIATMRGQGATGLQVSSKNGRKQVMAQSIHVPPRVCPYDPAWRWLYADEAALLHRVLAFVAPRIEHVGSTAVPGLMAKPVIDIMVDVHNCDRFDEARRALEGCGYVWDLGARRDDPGRQVFRKGPADLTQLRSHHLHLTLLDGDYWRRLLTFRDQLRRDDMAAAEYAVVKTRLITTCGGDGRAYTQGKRDVIKRIERAAGLEGS